MFHDQNIQNTIARLYCTARTHLDALEKRVVGSCKLAQNKGMALFPRRIGGKYVMLSRRDRENLHLSTSNDVHLWDDLAELYRPQHPWELLQVGNCGSPIETPAGWLVLTHGVGPMRRYAIGALLLDLEQPDRVIGHLPSPLIEPDASEREGYVPNVLYTCGALVHGGELLMPYGFSDSGVAFAHVPMADLLRTLLRSASTRLERSAGAPSHRSELQPADNLDE